jgi:branched-chain amino acid aminotransferase
MFYEKDEKLYTPPPGNILPGITRATVFEICREHGIPVGEKLFTIEEVKQADAAFFCGTAAEIIGWESIDGIKMKKEWDESFGKIIQQAYKHRVIEKEFNPLLEVA